jgi:glycosyltransferase involved in cell wall biosynthesis
MISFIIPTLNEEKVIEKTLQSLSRYKSEKEIIISDGDSRDKTVEIARKYTDKIFIYKGNKRQTIAQGRNDGAKISKGEFLIFFDADCIILEPDEFFSRVLSLFEKDLNLVAVTVKIKVLKEYETFGDRLVFGYMNLFYRFVTNVLHKGQSPGEFQMMRRSAYDVVGGFREELVAGEDIDMFLRLSKIGRTRFVSELTVYHTGRRGHAIGWRKLLWQWFKNAMSVYFFNKSDSEEWKEIR